MNRKKFFSHELIVQFLQELVCSRTKQYGKVGYKDIYKIKLI